MASLRAVLPKPVLIVLVGRVTVRIKLEFRDVPRHLLLLILIPDPDSEKIKSKYKKAQEDLHRR